MIGRLSDLTVYRDFAYIPLGSFAPNARFGPQAKMPTGTEAVEYGNIRLIQGLEQYYKVTGYEPARSLAAKLVRYAMGPAESYDSQGRFLFDPSDKEGMSKRFPGIENEKFGGHTHSRTLGLLCILEHATAVKDQDAMGFVKSGYEWVKTQGSSLVGFFPEHIIPGFPFPVCEGCSVGDMVALGVKMSVAGIDDYWDDVDRWVRNMFAEQQLTQGDWLDRMAASMLKKPVAFNESDKRVTESNIGGFGGSTTGNEWGDIIEHCCTGNCVRALYYVWEHMLEAKGEELRLNLLLNLGSSWADVYSYIPFEGRVDLTMKKSFESVLVRAPEWVKAGSQLVVCKVNGVPRNGRWQGRYVSIGRGVPGDKMVVNFPIEERTVKETIGGLPYTLIIKGNTVVSIDRPGRTAALSTSPLQRKPSTLAESQPLRTRRKYRLVIQTHRGPASKVFRPARTMPRAAEGHVLVRPPCITVTFRSVPMAPTAFESQKIAGPERHPKPFDRFPTLVQDTSQVGIQRRAGVVSKGAPPYVVWF